MPQSNSVFLSAAVAIVGIGSQTAVGESVQAGAAAVRAGLANVVEHPWIVDSRYEPAKVAMAGWLPKESAIEQRMSSLAEAAVAEAMQPVASFCREESVACPVFLGLPDDRPGFTRQIGARVGERLLQSEAFPRGCSRGELFYSGHAAGLLAMEAARRYIADGASDIAIAGGVDSYLDFETIRWLDQNEQLHSLNNAWGFMPGEGAGFVLLASERFAKRVGLSVLASVVALSNAKETKTLKSDGVCIGEGLTQAFRGALAALPPECKVSDLICDLNGETCRADEFGFALVRTSDHFAHPGVFRAPADCWGDVGAASGPLFVGLFVASVERGYARGPFALLCAGSENGDRCAALLAAELPTRENDP